MKGFKEKSVVLVCIIFIGVLSVLTLYRLLYSEFDSQDFVSNSQKPVATKISLDEISVQMNTNAPSVTDELLVDTAASISSNEDEIARRFNSKTSDYKISNILKSCSSSHHKGKSLTEILREQTFSSHCKTPITLEDFICTSNCIEREPELEEKMEYFSLQNYTVKMLKSYCKNKQISGLIWIYDNQPKYLPCEDNRIHGRVIWNTFQALLSLLSCSIKLPNLLFAFDNGDYAIPRGKVNWVRPIPGIIRYAGLPSHPAFLFPIREFIVATTIPSIGALSNSSLRLGLEVDRHDACKIPFHERKDTLHWRGQLTGNFLSADFMGFNPRLRLVEKFGRYQSKPGQIDIDVGVMLSSSFKKAESSFIAPIKEYGTKSFIPNRKFCEYKYLLHVEGNSFAGSFAYRLSTGSLVLKVDSSFGFYEFYYNKLVPWRHYVPIHKNLDNLQKIVNFLETNEGKQMVKKILQNVQEEVFDRKVGILRPEANLCYIIRLLYSMSLIQENEPTSESLKQAGLNPVDFISFPSYTGFIRNIRPTN